MNSYRVRLSRHYSLWRAVACLFCPVSIQLYESVFTCKNKRSSEWPLSNTMDVLLMEQLLISRIQDILMAFSFYNKHMPRVTDQTHRVNRGKKMHLGTQSKDLIEVFKGCLNLMSYQLSEMLVYSLPLFSKWWERGSCRGQLTWSILFHWQGRKLGD